MPAATSVSELSKVLGTPRAPIIVDVRRDEAFKTAEHLLAGAIWRSPQRVQHWRDGLPRNRPLVVYCAHGQEVSQGPRSVVACSRSRWACPRTFQTTTKCSNTAW